MTIKLSGKTTSGLSNVKGYRTRDSDGAVWSTAGTPGFQAYSAGSIADYGIAATERGLTGDYLFTDPADTVAGRYQMVAAAGASLVVSDLAANVFWEDAAGPQKANMEQLAGVIAPVTNLNTIFNTDYASVYDATNKAFLSRLGNFAMGGASLVVTYGAAQDFSATEKASITTAVPTAAAIATQVETQILDDGDSRAVLQAIVDKINAADPDLSGLTLSAIAAAVRDVSNAAPAGGSLGAVLNALQSDTDNIQTRIPAALTADGNMKADALKIGGAAPNNLAASDVGAQIEISLFTTPRTLPGQVEPSTTPTLGGAVMDIFQEATAPYEQDANEQRQYDRTHTTVLRKRAITYVETPTKLLTFLRFTVGP